MAEEVRHLRLAVDSNGEVQEQKVECAGCLDRDLAITRLVRGYEATIRRYRAELEAFHDEDPAADQVREVLGYWATRVHEEGWWSRKPKYKPGHPRWSVVNSRLRDGYDVEYCKKVVEGALMRLPYECSSCGTKKPERAWLDAISIFREGNIEGHHERARDEHLERVRTLRKLPPDLHDADLFFLTQRCDCGHLRMEHSKPDPWRQNRMPCLMDCFCDDFADYKQRVAKHEEGMGYRTHSTLMKTKSQQYVVDTLFDADSCDG